jgi:outer membrane protein assembly factor BamB
MWGGTPGRNAVSTETGIPTAWDVKSGHNVLWKAALGTQTYGGPVVADGKVYVGTNNGGERRTGITGDKGCVLCIDEHNGKLLWQATHDKLATGPANDWPEQGVASTPCVDGDRVYYVSNRCELVCADANGFLDDKNDGPFKDEKYTDSQDADFIWILDMIGTLGVYPHNLAACSPVVAGDLVLVCTGNGVDDDHEQPPAPAAPSFLAVDKRTGQVVWQRNDPGRGILHGQWSSPAYAVIRDRPQVIFGGGDGWCYAFDPATGAPLWKFDLNPKDSVWKIGGTGTKSSIVATPVACADRVYLAVGDDPEQGTGPGHFYALDATKSGDITESGGLWHIGGRDFGRTISSAAVADGLVYAADFDGYLSCCDADTGKRYWKCDLRAAVWGSPLVVDGKVMVANADGEVVILRHGRELKELARNDMGCATYTTLAVADGTLFIATQKHLYAISAAATPVASQPASSPTTTSAPAATQPITSAPATTSDWSMFRGNPQLTGVAGCALPERLSLRWKREIGGGTASTAAIVAGTVYVGADDKKLYALDLATGEVRWTYAARDSIESSPTVIGELVVFGDNAGVLHACEARNGAVRWTFATGDRIVSSVNWSRERLVFGSYDAHLYCLRVADGTLLWKYDVGERVHGTPSIIDGHVLVACCDANLHVVQLTDGTAVRKIKLGGVSGSAAAVVDRRVFLPTYGQQVLAMDWQTGEVLWRYEDAERAAPYLSSAAVLDDWVLVAGRDKRLRALAAQTGRVRWEFAGQGKFDSSPVIVGERAYVGCHDGNLYAVDLKSGQEVWRFEAGGAISASPAIGAGRLVMGTEDGVFYCFGSSAPASAPGDPGIK